MIRLERLFVKPAALMTISTSAESVASTHFHNKEELTFRTTAKRKNHVVSDRLPSRGKRYTEAHRSIEVLRKKLDFTSSETLRKVIL